MLSIQWRHVLAAVVHAVACQHDGWRTVQVVAVGRERTDPVYLSAYKEGPRRYCRFLTFLISHVETRRTTAEWKCLSFFFCASDVMCRTPAEQRTTVYIWGIPTSAHVQSVTVFDLDFGEKSHYIFTIERLFIVGFFGWILNQSGFRLMFVRQWAITVWKCFIVFTSV